MSLIKKDLSEERSLTKQNITQQIEACKGNIEVADTEMRKWGMVKFEEEQRLAELQEELDPFELLEMDEYEDYKNQEIQSLNAGRI
jgi:hypothetical protein